MIFFVYLYNQHSFTKLTKEKAKKFHSHYFFLKMMHVVKKMVLWYDYCVWKVMHMKCWNDLFQQEIQKPYYQELMAFLDEEYKTKTIFPPREDLFTCFDVCPYEKVKVVILGQDPYHQPNQAHGLCFSVRKGVKLPPMSA